MNSAYPEIEVLITTPVFSMVHEATQPSLAFPDLQSLSPSELSLNGESVFVDPQVDTFNFQGHRPATFFDDLYFKIHFDPGSINLGNILSARTTPLKVWNAHLSPVEITNFTAPVSDGLEVEEPVVPPYTMGPVGELTYTVNIDIAGPPQFSVQLQWVIDGNDYVVPVSGRRVVVWPFGPNWDQQVSESLEWKTHVSTAFDGTEERVSLRSKPRRSMAYRVDIHGNLVNQFQNMLYGWQDRQFAVPVWFDRWIMKQPVHAGGTHVPVTTDTRSFSEGGMGVLMTDTFEYEVFEIDQVQADQLVLTKPLENDWGALTNLYPVNLAMLPTNIPTQRLTNRVLTANLEWRMNPVETDPYIPSVPAVETYQGFEVIYRKPNWISPVGNEYESSYDILDYQTGGVQAVQQPSPPRQVRNVQWLLKNRQDIREFRELLGRRQGQSTPAYIPSWYPDFILTDTTPVAGRSLRVKRALYDQLVGVTETQRTLLIRLKDGTTWLRQIVDTSLDGDIESLQVDESFPVELTPENVLMLSLVHLCRLRQDGVTINYQSDSVATVEFSMTTVKL